jgi:hypothetical protein
MMKFEKDLSKKSKRRGHEGPGENFNWQYYIPPLIKLHIKRMSE